MSKMLFTMGVCFVRMLSIIPNNGLLFSSKIRTGSSKHVCYKQQMKTLQHSFGVAQSIVGIYCTGTFEFNSK